MRQARDVRGKGFAIVTVMKKTARKRQRRNPTHECEYCGKRAARLVKLNHTFGRGARMVVIADVDTMVCDNCGQSYPEGETLERVNKILSHPDRYAKVRDVAVADFKAA